MEAAAIVVLVLTVILLQRYFYRKYIFRNLEYSCSFSTSQAYEGDEVQLTEIVHNNKLMPIHWLKVELRCSKWLEFAQTRSVVAQDGRFVTSGFFLRSYQKTVRQWKVRCLKRGIFEIKNVALAGGDFLGSEVSSIPTEINARLEVLPAPVDLEMFFKPLNCINGDIIVRRWLLEDPFIVSGAREYSPGDPLNRINWQATARQGKIMVRNNEHTANQSLYILLNIQSMEYEYLYTVDRDVVEFGIKAAAAVIDRAFKEGMPVGLATNGCTGVDRSSPVISGAAAGRSHAGELLDMLAQLELRKTCEFEDFIETLGDVSRDSDIVIISAYLSENLYRKAVKIRRGRRVKVLILEGHASENYIPYDMDVYLLERESKQQSAGS